MAGIPERSTVASDPAAWIIRDGCRQTPPPLSLDTGDFSEDTLRPQSILHGTYLGVGTETTASRVGVLGRHKATSEPVPDDR